MLDRSRQWLIGFIIVTGICAVLGVAGTVSRWQPILMERVESLPPTTTSQLGAMRSQIPLENLRVEVSVEQIDPGAGRPVPVQGYPLKEASIDCPVYEIDDVALLPGWVRWCRGRPLNLPVVTDAKGHATLWYSVDPSPYSAGLGNLRHALGGPSIRFILPNDWSLASDPSTKGGYSIPFQPKILFPDHWELHITLVRTRGNQ